MPDQNDMDEARKIAEIAAQAADRERHNLGVGTYVFTAIETVIASALSAARAEGRGIGIEEAANLMMTHPGPVYPVKSDELREYYAGSIRSLRSLPDTGGKNG